jgi:hypothetical protein
VAIVSTCWAECGCKLSYRVHCMQSIVDVITWAQHVHEIVSVIHCSTCIIHRLLSKHCAARLRSIQNWKSSFLVVHIRHFTLLFIRSILSFSAFIRNISNKVTAIPPQTLRVPRFLDNRHMKVVMLSALHTGHSGKYSWYSFLLDS